MSRQKRPQTIDFAEGRALPLDFVTQTAAFLARKGAGKTYAATKLAEGLLDAGAQVVVLDPVGVYYGLRLDADGTSPGIEIPVLGGEHGDLPLEPEAGALVADLIVDRGTSAILDVSPFRKAQRQRFVRDFAEQLFQRKKTQRSPLHLILEEAQMFAPQRVAKGGEAMLGAVEDIVRLGRNYGIGATLISQRPQSVNKEVLNMVECLVVMQINGPQERKAIEGWIVDQGIDVREMVQQLPSLEIGEAFLWSPQWLRVTERIRIKLKRTYDASATPTLDEEQREARALEPLDLEELREQMAEVVERASANDPKALRAQIARLEQELNGRSAEEMGAFAERDQRIAQLESENERQRDRLFDLAEAIATMRQMAANAVATLSELQASSGDVRDEITQLDGLLEAATRPPKREPAAKPKTASPPPRPTMAERHEMAPQNGHGDAQLSKAEQSMLAVLARHPEGRTRVQIAIQAGYSVKSSSVGNTLGSLRTRGLISAAGVEPITITPDGLLAAGTVEPLPEGADLLEYWCSGHLGRAEAAMLRVLYDRYPAGMSKQEIAEATGYSPTSSSVGNSLGRLRTLGLITRDLEPRASDIFFEAVAA